ncbi:MAG: hypothetical protein GY712_05765 [Oceanicoccus sp.]|uniref:hypothetical protein n=1 Tax=Oceanicoccus sp. TaxID=2691044 RepID=UPI00261D9E1F|nr:hypothetical protein [Oceanicoccus sp.]MCP3907507.1 hypothetical protein [Oceanicoccus sp.]
MKRWILVFAVLPAFLLAADVSDRFETNDYIFVKAQIIGCGPQVRIVEAGQVMDTGQVSLFENIVLDAQGKTPAEVLNQLVDSLEQRVGRRSETIEIMRVLGEDSKMATFLMMGIHVERSRDCELESSPDNLLDWPGVFQMADRSSHNKSFKYVSALRASTGPKKAAPFWAA